MTGRLAALLLAVTLTGLVVWAIITADPARGGRSLAAEARWLARHGGITGTCLGCASPRMKRLVRDLIRARFRSAGRTAVDRALCISYRESAWNPGAISASDDHGVAQIHRASYHPFNYWRLTHDPVYSVQVFWVVSERGRNWSPWDGGAYSCG